MCHEVILHLHSQAIHDFMKRHGLDRDRLHLTQRLVELGHLGMIPACCLGLVAGKGQKGTEWSDAQLIKQIIILRLRHPEMVGKILR